MIILNYIFKYIDRGHGRLISLYRESVDGGNGLSISLLLPFE